MFLKHSFLEEIQESFEENIKNNSLKESSELKEKQEKFSNNLNDIYSFLMQNKFFKEAKIVSFLKDSFKNDLNPVYKKASEEWNFSDKDAVSLKEFLKDEVEEEPDLNHRKAFLEFIK